MCKESKGFAMSECNCRFCGKVLKNVQSRGRHEAWHVDRGDAVCAVDGEKMTPIDGKFLAKGVVEIPKQFEHPQIESDRSGRAVDRMKNAIILTSVAEMLEEVGAADQLLQMLAALRGSQRS